MIALIGFLAADAIHVSVHGKDAWVGTSARPVASISRAVELSRFTGARRIVVGAGEYPLRSSIALDSRDSGLVIEAQTGTRPLITGAVVVPKRAISPSRDEELQKRVAGLDVRAQAYDIDLTLVPGVALSPYTPYGFPKPVVPGPSELFADAEPMRIARWPNEGFTTVKSVREPGNGEGEQDKPPRRPVFTGATDRAKNWKSIGSAWLYGYWKYDWADESIKLHSVDPLTGEITLETPHVYGVAPGAPFFIENLPEELDAVGEYFADSARRSVQFVAERANRATYRISVLGDPLISLNKADKVTIHGLDFGYSRGNGADVEGCSSTRFEGCRFFNLGERGAVIANGRDSGLLGCDVWNTGEGGVVLNGGDRTSLTSAHLFVDNCDIHHYQRRSMTYRPGVAVDGVGNRVSHCAIHDAPHSAIIFGGNDHVFEFNEFFRTISRTGDGGVVYTGRNWTARGTQIRSNFFHDNVGLRKWEVAIYFDDLASGLSATDNLIERCHWAFLIGGGRDNVFAGNRIVDCKIGFSCDARGLGWAANSRSTMMAGLAAVPYQDAVWRSQYPALARILEAENPMAPAGNVIRGNILVRSGELKQQIEEPFAKTAVFEGNRESDETPAPALQNGPHAKWGLVLDSIRKTLPPPERRRREI